MRTRTIYTFIALLALLAACGTLDIGTGPASSLTPSEEPGATPVSPSMVMSTPTKNSVGSPTATAVSATDSPASTAVSTPVPTATAAHPPLSAGATPPPLAINSFDVVVTDVKAGKLITCTWETTGASEVSILAGTAQRFQPWWPVAASGTLTFTLSETLFPNPSVTLVAYDAKGNQVLEAVELEWSCKYDYFFSPWPACPGLYTCYCPRGEAVSSSAAEQPFENGRMIWLARVPYNDSLLENVIFVLYSDGTASRFVDTWTPTEPESDPLLIPPAGLYQPVRGFGKLWRENTSVRERLGWATAPETGFETAFQEQARESIGYTAYTRALDGSIIQLIGAGLMYMGPPDIEGRGYWTLSAPPCQASEEKKLGNYSLPRFTCRPASAAKTITSPTPITATICVSPWARTEISDILVGIRTDALTGPCKLDAPQTSMSSSL